MRTIPMLACALAAGIFSSPAFADTQTYCEVFGQDFANTRTPDLNQWEINFRNAFNDCMTQYGADTTVAVSANRTVANAAEKVVVRPARDTSRKKRIPILSPGTMAWNSYCASKYNSFNPATGSYRSHSGQLKPCLTPSD